MMEGVKAYLLALCAAGALVSVSLTLLPGGAARSIASLAGGLILIYVAVRPLPGIDWETALGELTASLEPARQTASFAADETESRIRDIIKDRCEAYIWDKAREAGVDVREICVEMSPPEEDPLPRLATVTGTFTEQQRTDLSRQIREDLGIRTENQTWIWNGNRQGS